MKLIVDKAQRQSKMRAHTATHLLHSELAKIFPHTKQAGSYVDKDITRFDFHAKDQLTIEQLQTIENNINDIIKQGKKVDSQEYSYQDAIKMGAKAFFGDKYGDKVRVVSISNKTEQYLSIELCGGTHVSYTSEIGTFKIINQEAVAAGIKRLTALTGPAVAKYAQEKEQELNQIAKILNVQSAQILKKLEKELTEKQELEQKIESLQAKLLNTELQKLATDYGKDDIDYIINIPDSLLTIGFKNIVNEAKHIFAKKNIVLRTSTMQFAILAQNGLDAKKYAQDLGLKGGGSNYIFQGKDPKIQEIG